MPSRLPVRCYHHGCPALVQPPERYCQAHKSDRFGSDRQQYHADLGNFYQSARWRKTRLMVLRRDPVCQVLGCNQPSEVVDHIVPISEGGDKLDPDNLQGLCKPCHDHKTLAEARHRATRKRPTK